MAFVLPLLAVLVLGVDTLSPGDYSVEIEFLGDVPAGDCCFAKGGLGCGDEGIAECVCGLAPDCCESGWGDTCAQLATFSCAADCEG